MDPELGPEFEGALWDDGFEWVKGMCVGVTGGAGALGRRLVLMLCRAGARQVRVLDVSGGGISLLPADVRDRVFMFAGDVRDAELADRFAQGLGVLFHLASYGMSSPEVCRETTRTVNVDGTSNVLRAARVGGVKALVYVSTVNVVFCGQPVLEDVGEDALPRLTRRSDFVDEYSYTKSVAEGLVLDANSPEMRTAALRPNGIYLETDARHLPRIIANAKRSMLIRVGDPSVVMQWIHGDNLAYALVITASNLLGAGKAQGRAFYVGDGPAQNTFDLFKPVLDAIGLKTPTAYVPFPVVYAVGWICEHIPLVTPLLTRAEVNKVGRRHTFSFAQAKRDLKLVLPLAQDQAVKRLAEFYSKRKAGDPPSSSPLLSIPFLSLLALLLALFLYFVMTKNI